MTSSTEQMRQYNGLPIFSFGFRPFFLAGAAVAAIIPVITALSYSGGAEFGFAAVFWPGTGMKWSTVISALLSPASS